MNKKDEIINAGINNVLKSIISAPSAFQSELDIHNEIYRVLYNKLKGGMYYNKSIRNKDKLIHSQHYADIRRWKKRSIRKRKDRSQVFFDMSICGKGYDAFLEFKFLKPFGFQGIYDDIKKIMISIDKVKTGFIININYPNKRKLFLPLYQSESKMISNLKTKIKRFQNNFKWFGVHKNKRTEIYYYFLNCNYNGDYQKIILKIKNSKIITAHVNYNGKNFNLYNL